MVKVLKYTLDFGTSNTLLGAVTELGRVPTIPLDFKNLENNHVLKSLIYTPNDHEWYYGTECYDKYLECEGEGRFFRSFKTLLSRESFEGTMIHGNRVGVVELVSRFLREARNRANSFYQQDVTKVTCGRPVRFGNTEKSDEVALERLTEALKLAGFTDIDFEYEPIAAARNMNLKFDEEKIVLVADIGAGTSDFSIIRMKDGGFTKDDILAVSGINVAGDSFDFSLMKNFIMPELGSKVKYKRPGSEIEHGLSKTLVHQMSTPAVFSLINDSKISEYIEDAQEFVECDKNLKKLGNMENLFDSKLGFDLMKEVEKKKIELSTKEVSNISYHKRGVSFSANLEQSLYFEESREVIDQISKAIDQGLLRAKLQTSDIGHVLCVGGGVKSPLVKQLISTFNL